MAVAIGAKRGREDAANGPPAPAKAGAANRIRCRLPRNLVFTRLSVISRADLVKYPG